MNDFEWDEYFDLHRRAMRNNHLPGITFDEDTIPQHHWKTRVRRQVPDDSRRLWQVKVGPGTINDAMVSIPYLRTGDPRGWVMPDDYVGIPAAVRQYGANFRIVDRWLDERTDPPSLLVTAPLGDDHGDFVRVLDTLQRPPQFRTEAMWEFDLYQAVVFVTATPARYSRAENASHFPLPPRLSRFRVAAAAQMPLTTEGATDGGQFRIAQLYLTRAHDGDPGKDNLYVRQRCFWSLWTATAVRALDLGNGLDFGTGTIDLLVQAAIGGIAAILESAGTVEFWSAA